MARAPRIKAGKAKRGPAKKRGGRPSHDVLDLALIHAAAKAALEANIRLSRLLRLNVMLGALPGNSKDSTIKRVQLKARRSIRRL